MARNYGDYFASIRPTLTSRFGIWESSPLPYSDPSYFEYEGLERFIGADSATGQRVITYCQNAEPQPADCQAISIIDDETGLAIEDDVDGPDIGIQGDSVVLAFSRGLKTYLAWPDPDDGTLLNWRARSYTVGDTVDDPSLSDDGQYLAFSVMGRLFVATWDEAAQDFVDAVEIYTATPEILAFSPVLTGTAEGGLEMVYSSYSRGFDLDNDGETLGALDNEIFVAPCSVGP